jgi:hypothetical protein
MNDRNPSDAPSRRDSRDPRGPRVHGVAASFRSPPDVYRAAERIRDLGWTRWDVHTPYPIHGLDAAMGLPRSSIPRLTLLGGLTGFVAGCLLTWYTNSYDYPLIVGGKPYWSVIYPFPVLYECTILFAAFGTFFGQFLTNRLPRHHHPLFELPQFARVTDDGFMVVLEAGDPRFSSPEDARDLLHSLGGQEITLVRD